MVDYEGTSTQIPSPEPVSGDDDDSNGGPLAGLGLQLSASLDLAIGKLTDSLTKKIDEQTRALRRDARQLPAMAKVATTFTYSSAATASIAMQGGTGNGVLLGGPEIGRQWNVRQVIITGTTLAATVNGVGWLLVAAGLPNDLSPTSVMDRAGAIPLVAFYGTDELYVQPNENVWLVITGGTNGAQYVVSLSYQDTPFSPRPTVEVI